MLTVVSYQDLVWFGLAWLQCILCCNTSKLMIFSENGHLEFGVILS